MRLIQLILITLFFHYSCTQSVLKYEQKISQLEDLEFKEISFTNTEDDIQLSGTLIYPKQGYEKIIMIVPGSGKDTRHSHFINPIIIDLLKQKHEKTYETSTSPILYIIGTEDRHVSSKNEIITLERLNNPNIETKIISNVDHYLRDELATSVYFMNKTAINEIINWTLEK